MARTPHARAANPRPALAPARRSAVLSLLDPSIQRPAYSQLADGFVHVIPAPDSRVSDEAIAALTNAFRMLGTSVWYVVRAADEAAATVQSNVHHVHGPADAALAALAADVERIRAHPATPKTVSVRGYVYDAQTGRMSEVARADAAAEQPRRRRAMRA